jgi:lipid A 3-O-deacylase
LWRSFFGEDRELRSGERETKRTRDEEDETTALGERLRIIGRFGAFAFLILIATVGARVITAQESGTAGQSQQIDCSKSGMTCDPADNPVSRVRTQRSWEYGPFVNWGTGLGNRDDYKFLWGGFELGKVLSPVVHARFLSGQFQFAGNFMPLWQAYTPPPHEEEYTCQEPSGQLVSCLLPTGGGTFYGVSLTPVIFRWNFATRSRRIQPWFQAAGGLIYTTHKYPPNILSNKAEGIDGGTSVWNFSPQGGGGIRYFLRDKRSIDLGVNGVHISSASLGDRNPGVNASIQVQVGYTFWR